jgi:hypothetical protein
MKCLGRGGDEQATSHFHGLGRRQALDFGGMARSEGWWTGSKSFWCWCAQSRGRDKAAT